jgi:hypothetical protein|eukprot:COSAG01_NODE_376_length_17942_cov_1753.560164_15_plen_80_part_00
MVVREDTVTLVTRTIRAACCCCECAQSGDEHEYYMLLSDINFIETGGVLSPTWHPVAMFFLTCAFAIFLASGFDYGWEV